LSARRKAKSVAEPKVLMPIFLPRRSSGLSMPLTVTTEKNGWLTRDDQHVGAGQPRGQERAAVNLREGRFAAEERR